MPRPLTGVVRSGGFAPRPRRWRLRLAAVLSVLLHLMILAMMLVTFRRESGLELLPPPSPVTMVFENGNKSGPTVPEPSQQATPSQPAEPTVQAPPPEPALQEPPRPAPPLQVPRPPETPLPPPKALQPAPEPPPMPEATPPPAPELPAPELPAPSQPETPTEQPAPSAPEVPAPQTPQMPTAQPAPELPLPSSPAPEPVPPPPPPAEAPPAETTPPKVLPPQPRAVPRSPPQPQTRPAPKPPAESFPAPMNYSFGKPAVPTSPSPRAVRRPRGSIDMSLGPAARGSLDTSPYGAHDTDAAEADWRNALSQWVTEHAFYPPEARREFQEGDSKVHVVMRPDGQVTSVELIGRSGSVWLDTGLVALFRNAHLPALPTGDKDDLDFNFTMRYILQRVR